MICPNCGAPEDNKVIDCRDVLSFNIKRRRRQCNYCGYRFTTYELPVTEEDKKKSRALGLNALHRKGLGQWQLRYI